MAVSVPLTFVPPDIEDLVKLYIYESSSADGPWDEIDSTEDVGLYPSYIDNFTTDKATARDNWFAIQWEDSKQARSTMTAPIQGGVTSLVGIVASRVRQRDRSLDYAVVVQEVEAAIEIYFGQDPYTVEPADVKYRILNGLAYLALARVYLTMRSQSSESVTLSLVSMRSSSASATDKTITELLDLAKEALGIGQSRVMQMADISSTPTPTLILEQ